ncbi:MAG TPA: signal peptidase II [Phycisphaerales bacterium]|nr:signal peptidase II [Phycisphaerales bacterium]
MSDHRSTPDQAWRSPRAWATFAGTLAGAAALDLATKWLAFERIAGAPVRIDRREVLAAFPRLSDLIPPHQPVTVVPGLLDLTLVLNPGAVFGVGAGKRWFFIAFTLIVCAAGVGAFAKWTRARDAWTHVALGLILGGGLGNLYDRLVFACVRDFLHPLPGLTLPFGWSWPWGGREVWPYVSNGADLFLIVGVAIIAVKSWRSAPPGAQRPAA